jgi:hypothetical protein
LDSLEWAHLFEQEHMSCYLGNFQWVHLVLVTNFGCNFELFALPNDCKLRSHPDMQPTRHALYSHSHTRVVVTWLSRVKKVASQLACLIGIVSKPVGLCGWNSKRALVGFLNFHFSNSHLKWWCSYGKKISFEGFYMSIVVSFFIIPCVSS